MEETHETMMEREDQKKEISNFLKEEVDKAALRLHEVMRMYAEEQKKEISEFCKKEMSNIVFHLQRTEATISRVQDVALLQLKAYQELRLMEGGMQEGK